MQRRDTQRALETARHARKRFAQHALNSRDAPRRYAAGQHSCAGAAYGACAWWRAIYRLAGLRL